MPQIKEYNLPQDAGLRPTETGIEATAGAARRIASNYAEAAAALQDTGNRYASAIKGAGEVPVKIAEHREVSAGAKSEAELTDALTKRWNDTAKNADPNDPTVAERFRAEVVEPTLDKVGQGFLTEGGQKWATARTERLRNHLYEKTSADMSTLAGQAAKNNVHVIANTLSNTAMNDPSSVPHLLGTIDSSIGSIVDSSPNLKGAAAGQARIELSQKMRENIVKAGAIGAIQKSADPEATAEAWGKKYPEYINGADLKMLGQNAKQQRNADIRDQKWNAQLDKQARQDKSDQREEDYLKAIHSGDPSEQSKVSTKTIVNDPNLTRQSKERMIGIVEREMKPETASQESNRNYIGILGDIRTGRISNVDAIYNARQDGKLNRADFNQALKDFTEFKSPQGEALSRDRAEFFKRYSPAIDPSIGSTGLHSALGSQKMYEAERAARLAEEDARKSGKDPHTVYDPSSPNFFGRPESIAKYRVPLQDALTYQQRIEKAAVPPKVGEEREGYRFKGGDPAKADSWDKVK